MGRNKKADRHFQPVRTLFTEQSTSLDRAVKVMFKVFLILLFLLKEQDGRNCDGNNCGNGGKNRDPNINLI